MATPPQVKALTCPNCGAGVQIRTYARTINVVCVNCLTILDASTPELQILQKFENAERYRPLIPPAPGYPGVRRDELMTYEECEAAYRRISIESDNDPMI